MPTTFAFEDIRADFAEFKGILSNFLRGVPTDSDKWHTRTGTRDRDWTVYQVLAHMVAIAEAFNYSARCAMYGEKIVTEGMFKRENLREWNATQIAKFMQYASSELSDMLLAELDTSIQILNEMTPESAQKTAFLPVYNRPARAIDFIDWQLSHAGIIHASQIKRTFDNQPHWEQYSPALTHRQIDRFVRHFSVAYWEHYAPDVNTAINFYIQGESGGDWHIIMRPDGGSSGVGKIEDAEYAITFDSAQTFFGAFTVHLPMLELVTSGAMTVHSDPQKTLNLLRLFSATPPKKG